MLGAIEYIYHTSMCLFVHSRLSSFAALRLHRRHTYGEMQINQLVYGQCAQLTSASVNASGYAIFYALVEVSVQVADACDHGDILIVHNFSLMTAQQVVHSIKQRKLTSMQGRYSISFVCDVGAYSRENNVCSCIYMYFYIIQITGVFYVESANITFGITKSYFYLKVFKQIILYNTRLDIGQKALGICRR